MPNQVPEDVSSRRIQELLKVQEECQKKALKRFIGTEEEVLVEGLSRRSDTDVSGHGLHGLSVTFPGTESGTVALSHDAVIKAQEMDPEPAVDGELQFDAAVAPRWSLKAKRMGGEVGGQRRHLHFPEHQRRQHRL